MTHIYPVLLAGGSGTRLWPLSRKSYPKQFSSLIGDRSLFQQAAMRLKSSNEVEFSEIDFGISNDVLGSKIYFDGVSIVTHFETIFDSNVCWTIENEYPDDNRTLPPRTPMSIKSEDGSFVLCIGITPRSSLNFSFILNLVVSLFNKDYGKLIEQFINAHYFMFSGIFILLGIIYYDSNIATIGSFPESWNLSIRDEIAAGVKSLTVNPTFIEITRSIRATVVIYLLRPLDTYLTYLPYWFTIGALVLMSWKAVGLRFAIVTAFLLAFIGACNIWTEAMITLSSVLISVLLCFVIGVPIGIIASYSKRFQNINEVILDAMQTLPYFCYLVPVLMFFGGGSFSALLATIIYAIPPIIRLTVLGLSQVSTTYSEVSRSFGGSTLQTLSKIKFPLAVPSLVMGFNQTVMMAFAMQIVTPLIGGKGLGLEVFNGLARSDTGRALAAGIGICLLAMIIDRISLAYTKKQRLALGLEKKQA